MDGGVGIGNALGVQKSRVDTEKVGQSLVLILHSQDSAISVLQDHEIPALVEVAAGCLRQLPQQHKLVEHRCRDASADIADHCRFAQLEPEDLGWIDAWVNAADDED